MCGKAVIMQKKSLCTCPHRGSQINFHFLYSRARPSHTPNPHPRIYALAFVRTHSQGDIHSRSPRHLSAYQRTLRTLAYKHTNSHLAPSKHLHESAHSVPHIPQTKQNPLGLTNNIFSRPSTQTATGHWGTNTELTFKMPGSALHNEGLKAS